jgi:hypothetical protein
MLSDSHFERDGIGHRIEISIAMGRRKKDDGAIVCESRRTLGNIAMGMRKKDGGAHRVESDGPRFPRGDFGKRSAAREVALQ